MPAIPPNLNRRLREILLKCGPFGNENNLRALFSDGRIYPWRDRVPEASSPDERVSALINALLDLQDQQGNYVLSLFLRVLADYAPTGDVCREQLAQLDRELVQAFRAPLDAPLTSNVTFLDSYPPVQFRSEVHQFVDREKDITNLRASATESLGVICIYGPPGVGKTALVNKLAQQLYENNRDQFPDGVLWSDLEVERSLESVLQNILVAYGFKDPYSNVKQSVRNLLNNKRALWVLDGADRMARGGGLATLVELRGNCTVLVTSRSSEVVSGYKSELQILSPESSLKLFQIISNNRGIAEEESSAQQICARLGHLPLAIRIAASWADSHAQRRKSIQTLLKRFDQMPLLDILKSPVPSAHLKDREIRASFEISWQDLESDRLRRTFACIGVFAGEDWDISAVAEVMRCTSDEAEEMLDRLVNKSLLEFGRTETRYSAHPLLREYAREKLESEKPELDFQDYFWRLAQHYQSLIINESSRLHSHDAIIATQRLQLELGNLQGVWRFCCECQEECSAKLVGDLVVGLWEFLISRGYFEEARELFNCAERLAKKFNRTDLIAEISYGRARLAVVQQSAESAIDCLQDAAAMYEDIADIGRLCDVWADLTYMYIGTGKLHEAEKCAKQVLDFANEVDTPDKLGEAHRAKGNVLSERGLITEALDHFKQAYKYFEDCGDIVTLSIVQREIGTQYRVKGEPEEAMAYFEKALGVFKKTHYVIAWNFTRWEIGNVYLQLGQVSEAAKFYKTALRSAERTLNPWIAGAAMCGLAEVYTMRDDPDTALRLYNKALSYAKNVDAPRKQALVLQSMGEIFTGKDQLDIALQCWQKALDLQQSVPGKEETLFALAYLISSRRVANVDNIASMVKTLVNDDHERAVLLVTLIRLLGDRDPKLLLKITRLILDIDYAIPLLKFPKAISELLKLTEIRTIGELLVAILNKTPDFTENTTQEIVSTLQTLEFWPKDVELTNTARYVNTRRWGGGGGCFPSGTQVSLPDGSFCAIERLKAGMPVLAAVISNDRVIRNCTEKITAVYCEEATSYYLINRILRVTGTHSLYTNHGWILARRLQIGDFIYNYHGQPIRVEEITNIEDKIAVYNINVSSARTFYAEDILVHNKRLMYWWG
jgi:tetratricopeptide (TPR) repeat protein